MANETATETETFEVVGPCANPRAVYKSRASARRAVDRLDLKYGAARHTYKVRAKFDSDAYLAEVEAERAWERKYDERF